MNETDNATETIGGDVEERVKEIMAAVDEKIEIEAIAQSVESFATRTNTQQSFQNLWQAVHQQGFGLGAVSSELRDLMMDMALVKRALASLGQIGVLERRRVEKELVLELFPPRLVRPGTGIAVAGLPSSDGVKIDCENRMALCKAACCRIFNVLLTPEEIEGNRYDWNPRAPYALHKNRPGCVHLRSADWSCSIYDCRPSSCLGYSCAKDQRIWADFEKKIINPNLKRELDKLKGGPEASQSDPTIAAPLAAAEERPSVGSPDFSPFRNEPALEPIRKFVPPSVMQAETASAPSIDGNGEPGGEPP